MSGYGCGYESSFILFLILILLVFSFPFFGHCGVKAEVE